MAASQEEISEKKRSGHQVWNEHIKKELSTLRINMQFCPNPHTMQLLPEKPNHIKPVFSHNMIAHVKKMQDDEVEWEKASKVQEGKDDPDFRLRKMIHDAVRTPIEKWDMPVTTSNDIGWDFAKYKSTSRWSKPRGSTPLTQYVQSYIFSCGVSPFVKKPNSSPSSAKK